MKFATLAVACLLLAVPAFAGRSLTQSASTSCSAFGKISITIKHGTCLGTAKADCVAHASTEVSIIDEVKAFFNSDPFTAPDFCVEEKAEASATAIAEALASVFTGALSAVSCDGRGFGCGFAVASGTSFATAYANAFVKAVAAVFPESGISSVCSGDVETIASGFANAASTSLAQACVSGQGSAVSFRTNFVAAATKVIANAFAVATAEACKDGDVKAEARCVAVVGGSSTSVENTTNIPNGGSSSTGSGTTGGFNFGNANTGKTKNCLEPELFACCFSNKCPFGMVRVQTPNPRAPNFIKRGLEQVCFCH